MDDLTTLDAQLEKIVANLEDINDTLAELQGEVNQNE